MSHLKHSSCSNPCYEASGFLNLFCTLVHQILVSMRIMNSLRSTIKNKISKCGKQWIYTFFLKDILALSCKMTWSLMCLLCNRSLFMCIWLKSYCDETHYFHKNIRLEPTYRTEKSKHNIILLTLKEENATGHF